MRQTLSGSHTNVDVEKAKTRHILIGFLTLSFLLNCSCTSWRDDQRRWNLSTYGAIGVPMPRAGWLFGDNPYCFIGEDTLSVPRGSDYLLFLDSYLGINPLENSLPGTYVWSWSANNIAVQITSSNATAIKITPLGLFGFSINRIGQMFVLSTDNCREGDMFDASITFDAKCTGDFPREIKKNEVLHLKIIREPTSLNKSAYILPKLVLHVDSMRIVKDCGEVRVEPGQLLWANWFEPYTVLLKKAAVTGANTITELQVLRVGGQLNTKTARSDFGFKARALVMQQ